MGLDQLLTRRDVLGNAAGMLAAACAHGLVAGESPAPSRSALARPRIALLGAGWLPGIKRQGRGIAIGNQALAHAELTTICEVDAVAGEYANRILCQGKGKVVTDYRQVLDRSDVDAVLIATPDHWHAKMSIDAMLAGKDVYCEKPATLTISEGRQMADIVARTGRVLQVGTQQRTEYDHRFARAVALVRAGRIGRLTRIHVGIEQGLTGGPFASAQPPAQLDWNLWLGPAPETPYIPQRTHWTFRWWYEYAGGKLTDWGAHHVDIAQWAADQLAGGPTRVQGNAEFQVPYREGYPLRDDTYNTPTTFTVECEIPGEVTMLIHSGDNGILFEGTEGRFFVNRGKLTGTPVEQLRDNPLPRDALEQLYGGAPPASHMENFFQCLRTRTQPVSDMESHQRTITTCHLANLALRLGRPLAWDAREETFVNDPQANSFLARTARSGFEIKT